METILKIETKAHGENSRKVATALNNLAAMKQQQVCVHVDMRVAAAVHGGSGGEETKCVGCPS